MTDIIERLRIESRREPHEPIWRDAIDEIEALRAEVERLRTDLMESDEIREKLGHLLTRTAAALKGEPPEGVWHSWHDLPEQAAQLVERVQRDEALLRQALEALEVSTRFVYADMRPQCEDTIAALRERLAETADDLTRCPNCGGPADNGHDREVPPNPYWCSKCTES